MGADKKKKIVLMVIFMPLAVVAYVFVTMYLWNWLVPKVFNGPELDLYETIGLLLLAKLIFWTKSSRGCSKGESCERDNVNSGYFDKWGCRNYSEKEKLKSRIKDLTQTPEDSEKE